MIRYSSSTQLKNVLCLRLNVHRIAKKRVALETSGKKGLLEKDLVFEGWRMSGVLACTGKTERCSRSSSSTARSIKRGGTLQLTGRPKRSGRPFSIQRPNWVWRSLQRPRALRASSRPRAETTTDTEMPQITWRKLQGPHDRALAIRWRGGRASFGEHRIERGRWRRFETETSGCGRAR